MTLPRFAEKSVDNLLSSIEHARKITLNRFIVSLSIPQVGEETAIDLAKHLGNINKMKSAKLEDFDSISNIGPVVSKSVYEWFQEKDNIKFFINLRFSHT